MNYSHVYTPKALYPVPLRYANVTGSSEQLVLLDYDLYNLGVITPREIIPFSITVTMKNIVLPETWVVRSAYIIAKNNTVLIRTICEIFGDETWKILVTGTVNEDVSDLPRILFSDTITVNGVLSLVELVEYTKASIVLFGPESLKSQFTSAISHNNYVHPSGEKKKGFMVAKAKSNVDEFKKLLTDTDFESLYLFPVGKKISSLETPGLPRLLTSTLITTETESFEIELVEYSVPSVVLFAPKEIESRLNSNFKPSIFQHPSRGRIPGYVCSKNTSRIEDFKNLFPDHNFENSYLYPITSKNPESVATPLISSLKTPSIVKQPLHMEIFNVLLKLGSSSELITQEIFGENMMIYGDVYDVNTEILKYTITKEIAIITMNTKKCIVFQAEQEEF
jgi:hypothetical protein